MRKRVLVAALLCPAAVLGALALTGAGGASAGAAATFCAKFPKSVAGGKPLAVTKSDGVIFYRDKKSKTTFYVCAPQSKGSSEGEVVDGASGFKLVKFAAPASGRCALAFVQMTGSPSFQGQGVGPLMVSEFHLGSGSTSGNAITANLTAPIGQVAFSSNCFAAWVEGTQETGFAISVANTANVKVLEDPNYVPGGVKVTTPADATGWSLKAAGKDVVLHYTDNGQPLTRTFTYTGK